MWSLRGILEGMTKDAPGQAHRKGLSLIQVTRKFSTEGKATQWFISRRWPDGIRCAWCVSDAISPRKHRSMAFHCRTCRKDFSVKTNSILHGSKIPLSKWAIAFYLYSTNLKGVSSMKLHRDLDITQKSAWHMAHRIREAFDNELFKFDGPVEVDEPYIGGKEGNKHEWKKQNAGRGPVGKAAVVGIKDRETNRIAVMPVDSTDAATLQDLVHERTNPDTLVFTDEARAYDGLGRPHGRVKHSVKEFVNGMIHTNGMESHWAMLKRAYVGVYHHMSRKHLGRYSNEFAGRHNARQLDTEAQMSALLQGGIGKRLPLAELIGPKSTRQPAMLNAWNPWE